ncbi:MAG TPA: HVA1 family protein [Nitrospiraceae bacterium]|nr:HVA1 family protein [Nitrospiraceae bacterium]
MAKTFKRGNHVEWNSEAGRVRGVIVKKTTSDVRLKGYVHPRLERGTARHHQEREDRSCGYS